MYPAGKNAKTALSHVASKNALCERTKSVILLAGWIMDRRKGLQYNPRGLTVDPPGSEVPQRDTVRTALHYAKSWLLKM